MDHQGAMNVAPCLSHWENKDGAITLIIVWPLLYLLTGMAGLLVSIVLVGEFTSRYIDIVLHRAASDAITEAIINLTTTFDPELTC